LFLTAAPGDYTLLLYPSGTDQENSLYSGFTTVPYGSFDNLPGYARKIQFRIADYRSDSADVVDVDGFKSLTEYRYALYGEEDGNRRHLFSEEGSNTIEYKN
jgi:hypothetical protein